MFVLGFLITSFIFGIQGEREFQCRELYKYDATTPGEVTSPFYYEDPEYLNKLWCEYEITAPKGHMIKITFKDLDIDPNGDCGGDALTVYGKDKSNHLVTVCGHDLPNPILSLEDESEIRLLFTSDDMVGGRGFRIQYESAPHFELCSKNELQCRNRNCYPAEKKCDGVDDCGDGTDEEKCGRPVAAPSDKCGEPPISPSTIYGSPDRQVGGMEAVPNSWPWQVSLQHTWKEPNAHFCGGTLINAQWVVTAGHCVVGKTDPHDLKIVLGSHNKYNKTRYQVTRVAEKIITYPDLEGDKLKYMTFQHDIAVIKLNAPVTFNDGIQPACLPYLGWDAQPEWHCYSTGWGETRGSGFSDVLKQTEQIIQHKDKCSYDVKTQICVDHTYHSPCHGDSGGPLVCKLGGKWFVFGATSFGVGGNMIGSMCGVPGAKVVFSNVADKYDWINKLIDQFS